jgi:hypothetical protein
MAMNHFLKKFPELATSETRTACFHGRDDIPDGEYGFIELYCDCRRVMIQVFSPSTGSKVWATINYGWENESFYRKWMSGDPEECMGIFLDPLCAQSEYSGFFLQFFNRMIEIDKAYVERLKRHYAMFREALASQGSIDAVGRSYESPVRRSSSASKAEKARRKNMRKLNKKKESDLPMDLT